MILDCAGREIILDGLGSTLSSSSSEELMLADDDTWLVETLDTTLVS